MAEKEAQKTFTIEIDGKSYNAKPGQMLIQVTDENNIYIPRFCYHKKLSIAANCRMCLVDVEGARKPSPACATPIMNGMKVHTKSEKTLSYQKTVMEFLLINHPLDCPICDQGGECELQDLSLGFGKDVSKFTEGKRVVKDLDLGPLVSTDLTRCIQCTRCVRFTTEIAGEREIGMLGRGEHSHISTYIERTVDSELSGNIIDVCPVGALTSKPYRFNARPWELIQKSTVSPSDGVGSNIYLHTRQNKVLRAVPKENEELNETWLSDRDRYSYTAIHSQDRLDSPLIKKGDNFVKVSWEEGIDFMKTALEKSVQENPNSIGGILSSNSTNEESYLLQKIIRSLGSNNIDSRLKQIDFNEASQGFGVNCSFADIEKSDYIIILGSNIRKENPLLNLRIKKAADKGAKVVSFNAKEYDFNYKIEQYMLDSNYWLLAIASLVKTLINNLTPSIDISDELIEVLNNFKSHKEIKEIANEIIKSSNMPTILIGNEAVMNKDFSKILSLAEILLNKINFSGGVLGFGSNSKGVENSGALPYVGVKNNLLESKGLDLEQIIFNSSVKNVIIANSEIGLDTQFGKKAIDSLKEKDFVISLSPFISDELKSYSSIILPITTFAENEGSYINYNGIEQTFKPAILPMKDSKPLWKILRVLGNFLDLDNFNYDNIEDVKNELDSINEGNFKASFESLKENDLEWNLNNISVQAICSPYKIDNLLRRAEPLQKTKDNLNVQDILLNKDLAQKLNVKNNKLTLNDNIFDIVIDNSLAFNTILVPIGINQSFGLLLTSSNQNLRG